MIHHPAPRGGGSQGFSLVELLIALAICAVVSAAIASLVSPARAAFERAPAAIELQQRGRAALDAITQALRSAGADVPASQDLGPLAALVPAVTLSEPDADGRYTSMLAITPRIHPAQGTLQHDQNGASGSLILATVNCPDVQDVCGFRPGTPAVIADGTGRFDIFIVATATPDARRLTAETPLGGSYAAGSIVVETEALVFRVEDEALVRETAAGAVQPIADRVTAVYFEPSCADGTFDGDWFCVRRVDVMVRLQTADGREHDVHGTVSLRNVR